MTENNESENRRIDINEGNYNERIEGNYVQGNRNFIFNFRRQGNSEALSSAKHSRIRQALLKQVNLEVESRINSSLHNRVYIVLDVEQNPEQIELPWSSEIKVGDQPKIRLDNTDIINVFDQEVVAGRLLILGQPGSGKTTMLLKLAEELLKRAKDNSTHPVPVLFSLSSWKNDNQNIKDWLVDQLKDKYGLRKNIGKQWINNQEIIPLLDGLDELVAERQEKCVLKINDFLHPSNWTNPLVVCSRIQEYQRYKTLLQQNNSLELYPFSPRQVYQYLQNTGHLQLWNSISHDADLSQLAKTPLLLNIIVLSAQEISIQTWQQFKSSKERLSYLFDAYIRRMLKRPYKDKQPKQENSQRWLSWMAHQLIEESATEFLIEKMQPDLLKNRGQKIIYNFILWGVIGALIFGVIDLIQFIFALYTVAPEIFSSELHSYIYNSNIFRISGMITGMTNGLIYGLIYGLVYGLIGDFIENKVEKIIFLINPLKKLIKPIIVWLIYGLIIGLIIGLINGLFFWFTTEPINEQTIKQFEEQFSKGFNQSYGQEIRLVMQIFMQNPRLYVLISIFISSLNSGLYSRLIFGLIGNQIRTTETIRFSFKKFSNGLKNGLKYGAILMGLYMMGLLLIMIPIFVLQSEWENQNILGLIKSLTSGNVNILVVLQRFGQIYEPYPGLIKSLTSGNVNILVVLLIFGLTTGLTSLTTGLIFGLISGLIGNRIWSIRTIRFSFKKFSNGLKNGLKYGAIFGLFLGLITVLIGGLVGDLKQGLILFAILLGIYRQLFYGLVVVMIAIVFVGLIGSFLGLFPGAIFGLFSGINRLEIENKTSPNQGIWQSIKNTIIFSAFGFFFASLIGFAIILKSKFNIQILIDSLILGIAFGILIGILAGGIPAIKHFILRVILWSSGSIPWSYAKFLNYCTNRLFLQRVGGSYRFMHDLLRQHFAKSYTQISLAPVQAIPVQPSPPQVQNHLVCTNCGHHNSANHNFCIKCGTKLNQPHI